jgi:dTDP-4-amino-4,6-dideoxygalactose transaminase
VTYARYPLFTEHKERLLQAARHAGVEVADWYDTPVHPLASAEWQAAGYAARSCPNAEFAAKRIISLPTHSQTSLEDADRAIRFLNRFRP